MGFIYEDNQTAYPTKPPTLGGKETGLLENLSASANLFAITNLSSSRKNEMKAAWQPIVDNINKKTNAGLKNPYETEIEMDIANPRLWNKPYTAELWDYNAINKRQNEIINFAKNNKDFVPEYAGLSVQTLYKQIADKQKKAEAEQADVAARQTTMGAVGEFAGVAWGAIQDPVNIGVTAIDFAVGGGKYKLGASVASNVLRLAFRDAAINAGSEALIQSEVANWYKDLKLPYDINTFLTNVGAAGVGGFVLRGGLESVAPLYQLTKKQLASGIETINKAKAKATGTAYEPDESLKAFNDASEIDDFTDANNIIPDDVGNLEHNTIIAETIKNIEEGNSTKALTGQDITETPVINEAGDTDLNLFDGVDSVGHTQQTDILLSELNDRIEKVSAKTPVTAFKNVDEIPGISIGPGGLVKPSVIETGNSLYRETNVSGLNGLLWIDNRFEYNPMFVANSKELAIGQAENKGIKIKFRPNSLSGKENIKPGTAGGLGDIVGREYKTDIIAPEAIQEITVDSEAALKGITKTAKNVLNKKFDKIQNEDGSISFVRKQKQQDNTARDEFLNQTVPVDKLDPNTGEVVQSAMTVREILEEAEQDKKMVDRLMGCLT